MVNVFVVGDTKKMPWQDDEIAGPMGYKHCVLFDCARDALKAYPYEITLPGNICPSVYKARPNSFLEEVDQATGLAKYSPTHLYGYQSPAANDSFALSLDPLMTGWLRQLKTESAIISFGHKKVFSLGYGGAFLTNDKDLARSMEVQSHWNESYTTYFLERLAGFSDHIEQRREIVGLWDRYLGDSLIRIPQEQIMPWRVMRRAVNLEARSLIVAALREAGFDVGTNYPPLTGSNEWGDTVLNFFCTPNLITKSEIQGACEAVERVLLPW
jgi:hypothetical protein